MILFQDEDCQQESSKDGEAEDSEESSTSTAITRLLHRPTTPSSSNQSVPITSIRKRKSVPEAEEAELLSLAKARLTNPSQDMGT